MVNKVFSYFKEIIIVQYQIAFFLIRNIFTY